MTVIPLCAVLLSETYASPVVAYSISSAAIHLGEQHH